ncbi:MAG TPA: ABC transporter permease [Vicinamibacterales bacterium]|nr:ABC transporter permease [Vicinamibacterales bacterium]
MPDRELRHWKSLVRERADRDWRELSLEVVDELACHLADLHAAALRGGNTEHEARQAALDALNAASFLNLSKRPRSRRGVGYGHDVRIALRQLIATPIVSTVAVLSLALGIGANTAIFSLVNSLTLRALPVKAPHQLAILTEDAPIATDSWTYPIWRDVRQRLDLVESGFAWDSQRVNLANGGVTEFADAIWTTAGMFDTLGVAPLVGRTFTEADDRSGGGADGPVAVISYAFWQRRFGGAADAIGRRLSLERIPFTIIGVMPPDFFGPDVGRRFDVALPIGMVTTVHPDRSLDQRDWWWLSIMVRLKGGVSVRQATDALRAVQPQVRLATLPDWSPIDLKQYLEDRFTFVPAATGNSSLRARYQRPLLTIMVVVVLVLLIACANIANLLLARATARRHEWSVRLALGASRWRLVRLLLTESLLLSAIGAGVGFLVARWGSQLLVAQLSTQTNTVFLDLSVDWRVLAFTTGTTVITALLFGVAPAYRAAGVAPMEAIKEQGRGPGAGASRLSLASTLVVVQVALSVILVVAAALFLRTFTKLATLDLGFDHDRVLVVTMSAEGAPIAPAQRMAVFERARRAVAALPGVHSAALSFVTPLSGHNWGNRLEVSGGVALDDSRRSALRNHVSTGFFETYGQRVVAGRVFTDRDRDSSPPVAIVNEAFARRFLNGANPIGHTLRRYPVRADEAPLEIVGMVGDAVYRRLRDPVPPTVYSSAAQSIDDLPTEEFNLNVRAASRSSALLTRSIADAIGSVDKDLALTFRPLSDQISASLTQERIVAMLAGFFGALALLLAGLGLYGVTSYAVSRRRTEIGIRMALGAAPAGVVRLVLSRVSMLVGLGVLIGAGVSFWASQFVATLLYGLEPRDPVTLAGSVAVLSAVGAVAGWLPARRAARIDPAEVLRDS